MTALSSDITARADGEATGIAVDETNKNVCRTKHVRIPLVRLKRQHLDVAQRHSQGNIA